MVKAGTIHPSHTGLLSAACRAPGGEAGTLPLVFGESLALHRECPEQHQVHPVRVVSHLGTWLTWLLKVLSYWGQSHTKQLQGLIRGVVNDQPTANLGEVRSGRRLAFPDSLTW